MRGIAVSILAQRDVTSCYNPEVRHDYCLDLLFEVILHYFLLGNQSKVKLIFVHLILIVCLYIQAC